MRGPLFPDALPCCDAVHFVNPPHAAVVYQLVFLPPPNDSPRTQCINSSTPHTVVYQIVNSTPAAAMHQRLKQHGEHNKVGRQTRLCRRIVDHLEMPTEVLNAQ